MPSSCHVEDSAKSHNQKKYPNATCRPNPLIQQLSSPHRIFSISRRVSLTYTITLLSALLAVSLGEDINSGEESDINSNTTTSPATYAYSLLGGMYNNMLFAKATDTGESISRRAIFLDSEQLFRRQTDEQVTCKGDNGNLHTFKTSECVDAARQLSEQKTSKAVSGDCSLSLISPSTRVQAKNVFTDVLVKATLGMMKACANNKQKHDNPNIAMKVDDSQVAMLLSKAS
ncbi:hypothetical protein H4Q26_005109 [Puccinia striiformis f. sp. tritici PST-130]|nr:hypothetical protein H4Q26_005109 [Puccinia striiformis f. sp. tritici PST-130]